MRGGLLILPLILILVGCTRSIEVQVVDVRGRSVQGAEVIAYTDSLRSPPQVTDRDGRAWVPRGVSIQATRNLGVTKEGFEPQWVELPRRGPVKVVLTTPPRYPLSIEVDEPVPEEEHIAPKGSAGDRRFILP